MEDGGLIEVGLYITNHSLTLKKFFTYDNLLDKLDYDDIVSEQKKDPGIPNLFPFKEDILKQAEEKKRRVCIHMYVCSFTRLWTFECFK